MKDGTARKYVRGGAAVALSMVLLATALPSALPRAGSPRPPAAPRRTRGRGPAPGGARAPRAAPRCGPPRTAPAESHSSLTLIEQPLRRLGALFDRRHPFNSTRVSTDSITRDWTCIARVRLRVRLLTALSQPDGVHSSATPAVKIRNCKAVA